MTPARSTRHRGWLSIRVHMLLIALLPALLTEIGLVAYFAKQNIANAERELNERAHNAARHLAGTLPYALVSGNHTLVRNLLKAELRNSQLAFAAVNDARRQLIASIGEDRALRAADALLKVSAPIFLPTTELGDDPGDTSRAESAGVSATLGDVVVGIDPQSIAAYRRSTVQNAALLVLLALSLTGLLAWRLSSRMARQLAQVSAAVGRIALGDLKVRADVPSGSEVGALAAGVNHMAEELQTHQAELQIRIHHATADLAAKKTEAERANIAKARFFAAASHDLRQPMHALTLFVAALKARSQNAEVQSLVDNIEASTAAMELLFNALLDISKLDAGVIEVNPAHFPLQALLDNLHSQFAAVALEKNLRLRIRPCAAVVHSDPLLLDRILVNLLSNAIRYTEHGGVLVGCRAHRGGVRICICDSGYGIPESQLDNVFHEFVQLHNPERDRNQGLGLGLAIVSRLGRLLGHRIGLRSESRRGSCFTITVPGGDAQAVCAPPVAAPPGAMIAGALIVLIDDEEAILQAMAELFDNWKLDLVAAKSAAEALHLLNRLGRTPDVIVSDYRLPGATDGLAVIAHIRAHFQHEIPAVLVTGDTSPDAIQRITLAGFAILHKPLRPAKLRALLTHLIQQARSTE
jgi:signal transduction histidine kinase/ActR/RegA family two-component response regulator